MTTSKFTKNNQSIDIRTSDGYYRETFFNGIIYRQYCGDSANTWTDLDGSPEQADIEEEIAEATK
jgi:hypothetical protein